MHAASEKQVGFLARLISEKDTTGIKIPESLEGISKKSASALIEKLIDRPRKGATGNAATAKGGIPERLASEKQVAFLVRLANERVLTNLANGEQLLDATYVATLTSREASQMIDFLMGQQKRSAAEPAAEIPAGAYRVDGRVIRVYHGQQSGKMLASELIDATAHSRDEAWNYLGLATRFVPADAHRMTVEECEVVAGSGQADHGWCCVCGRDLDDPNSVRRGIGPICRAKQGG